MPDQLTDRARKAAEEIAKLCFDTTIDPCEIVQGGCIDENGSCENHVSSVFAAIIERHIREMTLVELGRLVQQREKWLQKEIEAGRWLDCQGELKNTDRLTELEKELREGCEIIETVMHQYDEG